MAIAQKPGAGDREAAYTLYVVRWRDAERSAPDMLRGLLRINARPLHPYFSRVQKIKDDVGDSEGIFRVESLSLVMLAVSLYFSTISRCPIYSDTLDVTV